MADEPQPARLSRVALSAASIALGTALLTGCAITAVTTDPGTGITTVAMSADATDADEPDADADAETDVEADVAADDRDAEAAVTITMDAAGTRADGGGVRIDGSTVTITDTGTYVLRGALTGQVIVAAPAGAVVALVLDGSPAAPATTAA